MKLTRSIRAALLLLACLAGLSIPAHGRQVSLEPTSLELSAAPGDRERAFVILQNDSPDETVELTIGLADWTISADGQLELEPPGDAPDSMVDWVRFSPAYISLAPGESREILVDIKIPDTAPPTASRRTALLASAITPVTTSDGGSLLRKIEETSLIYLTGPDSKSLPVIEAVTRVLLADGSTAVRLEVSNTGTAHARLQGTIQMDANGNSTSLPLASLVLLPETRRAFLIPLAEPLSEKAMVSASLANTHAPQHENGRADLVRYSAPLGEAAPLR